MGELQDRFSRRVIERAINNGALRRLRRGWWAIRDADSDVVTAVSSGGVLSCASALRKYGVWVMPTDRVHIRGNSATSRTHRTWCRQHGRQPAADHAIDDLETALLHAARCLSTEEFVVVVDSVLNRGIMTESQVTALFIGLPRQVHRHLELCDGRAESGTETAVRLRLTAQNRTITPQWRIPEVGRVDMLIGHSLVIEVDGYAYHADPSAYENDRLRDLQAKEIGYEVIRLSYRQVIHGWHVVGPLLANIMARGDHLRRLPVRATDT